MSSLQPPQSAPAWTHSAQDVLQLIKRQIAANRELEDKVANIPHDECNFDNVFRALALGRAEFTKVTEPLKFYQNVSPSKELRDASNEAEVLCKDYDVDSSMRLDVFQAKQAAEKNIRDSGRWGDLSPEERRFVTKSVLEGTRAGLALPEKEREQLIALKKRLSQACSDFGKNFNEEKGVISFTLDELKGVPADVISGYTKRGITGQELYDVTFKGPDIGPILSYAQNPDTRRRAFEANGARLEVNVPILSEVLDLRRQLANKLGYDTWADYATEEKMAKSAKGVQTFLDDLEEKLKPVGVKDIEKLLELKEEEHTKLGLPFDGNFYNYDSPYYNRLSKEKWLDLDANVIREHFPVSAVVPAILDIYQSLLGLQFREMKAELWHPEVQQFAVWENNVQDESGFLGHFYLDLYPREGKFSHLAVWPLQPGFEKADGTRNYPLAALVASLAKPTPERPALMTHFDTVMFFHEMGHVFHELLSRTKFSKFHGTNVVIDFAEAPSQMLENWCWEPKVLEKITGHYETKKPMPEELIRKLIQSRHVNVGQFYLLQLFFSKYDLVVHQDKASTDYTALWNEMRESITLAKGSGKLVPGQAAFQHLTSSGGYDVGYYGYTYSLVFAADMYRTVFKADPFDPARGQKYRDAILKPGGSRDEMESLTEFLGRPPSSDAFLEMLFGTV